MTAQEGPGWTRRRRQFALAVREGIAVWRQYEGRPAEAIYRHEQDGMTGPLSRDATCVAIRHSEHGDAGTPGIRVLDVDSGESLAEVRDEGKMLTPLGFSPRQGDRRLLVRHVRHGRDELLLWDTASGTQAELDIALPGQIDGIWLDTEYLALRHVHHGRTTLHRYRISDGALEQISPDEGSVLAMGAGPGGDLEYVWTSSKKAPQAYRWNPESGSALLFPPSRRHRTATPRRWSGSRDQAERSRSW